MAWQDDAVLMLRTLIGDSGATQTFTDQRLEEVLVVSAKYINQEIDFDTTYTIDVNAISISPTPITDDAFMNFMVLKGACIIDRGSARVAAATHGLKARCGPAVMETLKQMDGYNILLTKGYCGAYEQAKKEWIFGNAKYVRAILSPFINANFFPADTVSRGVSDSYRIMD